MGILRWALFVLSFYSSWNAFAVEYQQELKDQVRKKLNEISLTTWRHDKEQEQDVFKLLVINEGKLDLNNVEDKKLFKDLLERHRFYGNPGEYSNAFLAHHGDFVVSLADKDFIYRFCSNLYDDIDIFIANHLAKLVSFLSTPNAPIICSPHGKIAARLLSHNNFPMLIQKIDEFSALNEPVKAKKALVEKIFRAQDNWLSQAVFLGNFSEAAASLSKKQRDALADIVAYVHTTLFPRFLRDLRRGLHDHPQSTLHDLRNFYADRYNILSKSSEIAIFGEIANFFSNEENKLAARENAFELSAPLFLNIYKNLDDDVDFKKIALKYFKYNGKSRDKLDSFRKQIQNSLKDNIQNTFFKSLNKIAQTIFSDLPKFESNKNILQVSKFDALKVIYNQKGFDTKFSNVEEFCDEQCKAAKALILPQGKYRVDDQQIDVEKDIPIGYNIHLPTTAIKAIYVSVYGGGLENSSFKKPMQLGESEKYLLSLGIVIVSTNLIDLLALEGEQDAMSLNLHGQLQLSINRLYEALRNPKSILDPPEAEMLKDKKIYLQGASFGGMAVLRHAELFPDTFDGYISHDGGLSAEVGIAGDIGEYRGRGLDDDSIAARAWLLPMTEPLAAGAPDPKIAEITKPILLLHNFDDNNVNVLVSIRWYQRALENNKGPLVRLVITRKGNPSEITSRYEQKGHFITSAKRELATYRDALASFVISGEHSLDQISLSKSQAHEFEIYAYQNFISSTLEQRFLSVGYRWYLSQQREAASCAIKIHPAWDYLGPDKLSIQGIYFTLAYLESLGKLSDGLEKELQELGEKLTEAQLDKAIKSHFPLLADYYKETLMLPKLWIMDALQSYLNLQDTPPRMGMGRGRISGPPRVIPGTTGLRTAYKDMLTKKSNQDLNDDIRWYLLYHIYMANSDLVKNLSQKYAGSSEATQAMQTALKLLNAKIAEGEKLRCGQ